MDSKYKSKKLRQIFTETESHKPYRYREYGTNSGKFAVVVWKNFQRAQGFLAEGLAEDAALGMPEGNPKGGFRVTRG